MPGVVLRLNLTAGNPPAPSPFGLIFIYLDNSVSQSAPPDFGPLPVASVAPTQWTHINAVVKVPAGVDFIAPELFFWKAKGSLYVDDFSSKRSIPKPLSLPSKERRSNLPPTRNRMDLMPLKRLLLLCLAGTIALPVAQAVTRPPLVVTAVTNAPSLPNSIACTDPSIRYLGRLRYHDGRSSL